MLMNVMFHARQAPLCRICALQTPRGYTAAAMLIALLTHTSPIARKIHAYTNHFDDN
jgi:hypothetical protein